MSVFICWSGTRSHEIAKAVEKLLKDMKVPKVFVSDHIEKGAAWFDSIIDELQESQVGIVCLTSENLGSPWMHFEAGALARGLSPESKDSARSVDSPGRQTGTGAYEKSAPPLSGDAKRTHPSQRRSRHRRRLFTVLHGVTAAEINGPLSSYQATSTTQREMGELVRLIKQILDDAPEARASGDPDQDSEQSALVIPDAIWTTFKSALEQATIPVSKLISDLGQTFQRKTFNEPLHHCADQAWLARYQGAQLTREILLPRLGQVKAACPLHERELFELLLNELDGYAMALQALLLKPAEFKLGSSGELQMDESIQTCCEDRRLAIKSIATRLLHPVDDPLTDEAVRFMAAETNEERKMIVHRLEARIRQAWEEAHEDASKEPERPSTMDNTALGKLVAGMLERQIRFSDREADKEESDQRCTTGDSAPARHQDSTSHTQKPLRLLRFRESSWDLDRIYYYLLVDYFRTAALRWESSQPSATKANATEQQPAPPVYPAATEADHTAKAEDYDLACAARDVEMEVERYRARSKGGSLTPLTYGLVALKALCQRPAARRAEEQRAIKSALRLVREELGDVLKSDSGRPIERLLSEIEGDYFPST